MIQGTSVNIGYANLNMTNHQVNEANVEKRYGPYFSAGMLHTHLSTQLMLSARVAPFELFTRCPCRR